MSLTKILTRSLTKITTSHAPAAAAAVSAVDSPTEKLDSVQLGYLREECIRVDEEDRILGKVSKGEAHRQDSMALHRAFSVFAFTPDQKLILQRRSAAKITFPSMWTNSCCSHPLHIEGEMDESQGVVRAAIRKLDHELGLTNVNKTEFVVLGRFLYKAVMADSPWGEHEMDYAVVLRNIDMSRLRPNPEEVSHVEAVDRRQLTQWIQSEPESFTPWFVLFHRLQHLSRWWGDLDNVQRQKDMKIVKMN